MFVNCLGLVKYIDKDKFLSLIVGFFCYWFYWLKVVGFIFML